MDEKNLFGEKLKKRPGYFEKILHKYDRDSFSSRLDRFKWLYDIFPPNKGFMMSYEMAFVFDEAKMCFMNGEYISTILLANSFIEHWLGSYLLGKGFERAAQKGTKAIIDCLRENQLLHVYLIDRIDKIRRKRNPFVHLKPYNHKENLSQRVFINMKPPEDILEDDAKEAISLMYQIAISYLGKQ